MQIAKACISLLANTTESPQQTSHNDIQQRYIW